MKASGTQYHSFPTRFLSCSSARWTQRMAVSLQLAQGMHIKGTTKLPMLNHMFNMIILNASFQQNVKGI